MKELITSICATTTITIQTRSSKHEPWKCSTLESGSKRLEGHYDHQKWSYRNILHLREIGQVKKNQKIQSYWLPMCLGSAGCFVPKLVVSWLVLKLNKNRQCLQCFYWDCFLLFVCVNEGYWLCSFTLKVFKKIQQLSGARFCQSQSLPNVLPNILKIEKFTKMKILLSYQTCLLYNQTCSEHMM